VAAHQKWCRQDPYVSVHIENRPQRTCARRRRLRDPVVLPPE
jgi:hypothetical protein